MKKNFFIIIFFILGLTHKSFSYSSDPKQFVQEMVDEVKQVLVETNTKEFKTKKLSEMALKTVDIKGKTLHRVQVGPFNSDNSLNSAKLLLKQNNIEHIQRQLPKK